MGRSCPFPVLCRLSHSRFVLLRLLESIARNVEFQDDAVVYEPVDRRGRRHGVLEDLLPFRKRQIAREDDAASFVTLGQQREQDLHLFAILLHVVVFYIESRRFLIRDSPRPATTYEQKTGGADGVKGA